MQKQRWSTVKSVPNQHKNLLPVGYLQWRIKEGGNHMCGPIPHTIIEVELFLNITHEYKS